MSEHLFIFANGRMSSMGITSQQQQYLTHDEVNSICKDALENLIGKSDYLHAEAVKWNQNVVEKITEGLASLQKPYKYCVCVILMQTGSGAGLNVASMCFWDREQDLSFVVRWESKAVIAVCNIFATTLETQRPPAPAALNNSTNANSAGGDDDATTIANNGN